MKIRETSVRLARRCWPLVLLATGCLSVPAQVASEKSEAQLPSEELPQYNKNHVYIFIFQGIDPLDLPAQAALREYFINQGYLKTYLGSAVYSRWYIDEMRRVHKQDPDARFVLGGYGDGADMARLVAKVLEKDGAAVDLLVQINAGIAENDVTNQPENVAQAVTIESAALGSQTAKINGTTGEGEDKPDASAVGYEKSLKLLSRELKTVAMNVPLHDMDLTPSHQEPTPVARKPVPDDDPDEWRFLRADVLARLSLNQGSPIMTFTGDAAGPAPAKETTPPAEPAKPKPAKPKTIRVTLLR